jgi:hypothetical protein
MTNKAPLPELAAAIQAAETKYADLPKGLLEKLAGIESGGGRNLVNPKSSARGPFQFMEKTGPEFGLLTEQDRMDFNKSTDAAARLLLRNKKDLERQIGRPATAGELYLAHQQGAHGAAKLLKNADKLAADVVGDPERIRLNGGDPATMTAGAFATKWTSKIDGGGGTAPGKKSQSLSSDLGRMPGVSNERDFYVYDPRELENLDTGALAKISQPPKVDRELIDVPTQKVSALADLARGKPDEAPIAEPSEQARPSRTGSAILQGLSTYEKTAATLARQLENITAPELTQTAPSGLGGEFSDGVTSGLLNISADQQYFGAIIDTLTGNEAGAKSRIFNAQQFEADSAQALAGMQSFEEFLKEPSFEGFISQVVSSAGQVAPSALDSIASALVTGGLYSLAKAGLSAGSKVVAKTLVKDLISKQAKGKLVDAAEKGILEGLYNNFKKGAIAGAFGSEYRMMAGGAFAEFGEGGAEMDAENAFKSLMIGVPQAAIGVWGEKAVVDGILKMAGKKATRSASTSILKKFSADVLRAGVKSGLIEGSTEFAQEGISVMQRSAIDPEFTLEDAQLRLGQAAFAGFFGGGVFGGAASTPAAAVSAGRSTKILDNAKKLLKTVSEARVETGVRNETTGVDDEALAGKATPESSFDIEAQMFAVLDPKNPKKAAFIDPESAQQMDVEPGKIKKFDIEETGQSVWTGHIPNKGVIASADPNVVTEVMTVYEAGGDVDAAIGEALGMVGGKEGDNVVRVKDADGAVVHEQVADDESLDAAREQASKIADAIPAGRIDEPTVQEAMEERHQKASLDKKEFNAEASALLAMRELLESEDDKAMDEKATAPAKRVEKHSQPTEPFLGKSVRPAPYHKLSNPDESATERAHQDELHKRVRENNFTVQQVPLKGLVSTQDGISDKFRGVPTNGGMHGKLPLIVKFKGVSYIEDGHHRLAAAAERGDQTVEARVVDLDSAPKADAEIKSKSMVLGSTQGDGLLADNIAAIEEDTSYENLKAVRDTLRKEVADSLKEPKPTPRNDLTPAEIHAAHDKQEAEVKRRVSIERAVSLLNDAIDAHEIAREEGAISPDLQRVVTRRAASAVEALRTTTIKSKSMVVGDEPAEGVADEEADTAANTSSIEDQLNVQYAEIDAKNATRIQQFPERTTNRDPEVEKKNQKTIDQLWLTLSYVVPEEQYDNYKKFKDRMPIKMLKKLIKLNEENNDDGNPAYYDIAEDVQTGQKTQLSITQRDPFPNAETTVTRDAVRDVIKQVAKMRDPKATLRKTEGKARAPSMFWLVNRNTGVAYRLNGTPKTKKKKGRSGVALLAQAGIQLNIRTQQALSGRGLTKAQSASQGLMTMLKALAEAGYDFKVGKFPTGLIPFDPQKLPAEAVNEPVMTIAGIEGTITDLLYVKAPFEASKSDVDASVNREQLSDFNMSSAQVTAKPVGNDRADAPRTRVVTQETMTDAWSSQPEQFAAAEDKKKRLNNVEDELAQSAERDKEKRDEVAAKVEAAKEQAKETRTSAAKIIEEELEPLPSDVTVEIKQVGNGWQATVSSPRMERKTITSKNKKWVVARAHALAVSQPDNNPIQYNRLALETTDATEKARDAHPEILGVPAEKNQTSVRDEPGSKTSPGTNKVSVFGNIGKLTGKVLAEATKMFNLHRPLTVMTLAHLKQNFDALTGEGGKFARAKDTLADIIDKMDDPALDNPAHVLMGGQYLIILRDEPNGRLDLDGNDILAPDDAKIGAVLAHEIGHIVFEQEFARVVQGTPLAQAMWEAYTKHVKTMTTERGAKPVQYTNDKEGFEEWYADQVMAYVYNEANQAKGITQSYFKRIAKALREFFHRVNDALGGRLKLSRENISTIRREVKDKNDKTVIKQGGTFADYMDQVVKRNAIERAANNTFPVADQMKVRAMILNLQGRIPANAVRRMQTAAVGIMRTGTWGKLGHGLMNIFQASTDFMGATEHGVAGQNLKTFFGTLSQSMDKLGWNKRELFAQNRWNNELANIFGFDDKTNPKEWESAATRAIMVEAMNEDLTDAQLSTPEAKAIRELYKKIETQYLKKPGGQRAGYYIPDFTPRANYGGPRMWNIDKIAKNEQAFVTWLADQLPQTGNPAQRAKDIFDEMTQRTKNQVELIERQVETDLQATGRTNATPATRAAWEFEYSMKDRAVMEMRDKILRNIRRGAYTSNDVITTLFTMYPADPDTITLMATPADQQVDALKKYWMKRTEKIRLTPGMDPALNRKLAPDVKTIDAYNADPNDPNGWLLPPALAHAQYMHYIARRVEYEKMGIERGARSGSEYVMSQLHAVPEEYRMQVDAAIMANLGKFGENMSNGWRAINSIAAVWTVFTTLLFTTLSSVTDMAGIATRSKDFNNLGGFIDGMKKTLTTREFQELARSVGVVTGRTQEHMMIGQGELDYANKSARSIMNGFFRYTGLEWYTKFTRSFAVGMGREFILNTANNPQFGPREERYLAELGLTRAEVQSWAGTNQDFTTSVGEKVRLAIARFADEAIIRPDASQRPTWASNPYLQTVWQLKSYYYGFGKTVLGGLGREIKNRYTEDGNFNGAAQSMMLYAVTIIPLTMFGMASRDWMKWLFQLALPGVEETASTSMKLDTTGYMWEIFKRSGTLGPLAIGLSTMEAFKFEGIAAPFTANVPMFDLFDDTIFDGDLTRPLPVINNIK